MPGNRTRHCWECHRRSVVCDFTHPQCKRCSDAGIKCPGYEEAKPLKLKWLEPGRVKSRRPNRKPFQKKIKQSDSNVVAKPSRELKTDVHTFVQAAEYYNACVYPDILMMTKLGQNVHIYPITPPIFQRGIASHPDYIRLVLVCMMLSHRLNRTTSSAQCQALTRHFLHYRGQIIRTLSDDINLDHKCTSDFVIAGMLILLLVDAQQGASTHYRYHLDGVRRIFKLRGGIRSLSDSPGMKPLLLFVVFAAVMGDTSSPTSNLTMATTDLEDLDFMLKKHGDRGFALGSWPAHLFKEVIKINHLRFRALTTDPITALDNLTMEALETLLRIQTFSPSEWASSKLVSIPEWTLMGTVHQDATTIYCIRSLQSLGVLPQTAELDEICTSQAQHLMTLSSAASSLLHIRRMIFWDLVVLGVEGVADANIRSFVRLQLPDLSHVTGTYVPLMAKGLLERFWASGKTDWDACFDQPYTFAMHMSVDVSGLR